MMDLWPDLSLTLFNGWIFLIFFYILQFYNVIFVSIEIREKLFFRSNFDRKQWLFTIIGKFIGVCAMLLMTLTPIAYGTLEFLVGLIIYLIGMIGLRYSVINFITTPLNQPVTKGMYSYSRNPQEMMLTVILFGIGIIVSSWIILILLILSKIFNHFQILAQEEACIKRYGDSYREYLKRVPRYFLFF
ncbi:methyltransferase family protein [Candidatus Hodarchaeum mangrovi]